jgi:hypothetical protein
VSVAGTDLTSWLDGYLDAFAACGRGEREPAALREYFAPPVRLGTDEVSLVLADSDDVLGWARAQVDGMRAAGFDRIEVLDRAIDPLNATTTLVRGSFVRRRRDGSEITRVTATYLVVTGPDGPRFAALVVHSPDG